MKFLCPQCKAKYRIAEDRLAERAMSRMKCRKCGHVIDIHAASVPESMHPHGASHDDDDDEPRGPPRAAPAGPAAVARRAPVAAPKRAPAPPANRPAPPQRRGGAATAQVAREKPEPASEEEGLEAAPAPTNPMATHAKASPRPQEADDDALTPFLDGKALSAAFNLAAVGDGSIPPQSVADEWYVGIGGSPIGPISSRELGEKAAAGDAGLDSLVWRDGFEEWKPLKDFPELVALVEEAKRAMPVRSAPAVAPAPAPAAMERGAQPAIVVSEPPGSLLPRGGHAHAKPVSHPAAWAAVAVAMAFGVTIGIVVFSKTEKQVVTKYVEVPASARVEQRPAPQENPQMIEEATISAPGTKHAGGGPKAEASASATPGKGLGSLSGLSSLNGMGPAAVPGSDVASAGAPGGQLDGASIQRVVANFSSSVRRGCWDSALSSRGPDAPSSARVGVVITISASGSVDNVTTTGDPKGYPNLAHCIESKVRGWRFPHSSGQTTANVPFVFAVQ